MKPALAALLAAALTSCATAAPPETPEAALDRELAAADVVFFGEVHDQRSHHAYELELLAGMIGASSRDGRPLLLGMEAFQRPFQAPLDDYVASRIDEREMLRRTEYFARWNFDCTFYAPLWRSCQVNGVRVVALNADGSIITKVRKGPGLSGLSAGERAQLAADIGLSDAAHRARVEETFRRVGHPLTQPWYEAMTAWDETMAETACLALDEAGPRARMLVVAGRGHVEDGTGIPDRLAKRLPGKRRVVVVGESVDGPEAPSVRREGGQFVVAFAARQDPPAPKLGVEFDTNPADGGLLVKSVVADGAASKAGVVAGDVLARLEGEAVRDVTDVRYLLDPRRSGDVVAAEVLRGGVRVALTVTLAPLPPAPSVPPGAAPAK